MKTPSTKMILSYGMLIILFITLTQVRGHAISSSISLRGRNLLQSGNVESTSHLDDTVRVDPLDGFKKYRGGYDLTNKHYWGSTAFTGIYGYAIALLWLLCGLVYGGYLLVTTCCCKSRKEAKLRRKRRSCCKLYNPWSLLLAAIFAILAMVASGLVIGGNVKFDSEARTVVNIIINTANEASETIYNTTGAIADMNNNLSASNAISTEDSRFLTTTSQRLDSGAADIQRQARKNRRLIRSILKIAHIITIVTISVNLAAVIALSVSGFLKLRRALNLLLILCWVLTILCWILFGVHFFLEKFAGDTCTAVANFQNNPNNNSLSSILPCERLVSAKSALSDVSAGVYEIVNQVNANITLLRGTLYPDLVYVCNPFSAPPEYQYQPDNCPTNTIRIGDIPKALKIFMCSDATNGTCQGGLISNQEYQTVEAYTTSIQSLLNAYPGMENLVDCRVVKDAFTEILQEHCSPVKRYVRMVWVALLVLSVIMVALVSLWTAKAYIESNHVPDGSVKPNCTVDSISCTFNGSI